VKLLLLAGCLLIFFAFHGPVVQKADDCKNLVPDDKTAVKIAEAIWFPIYGDSINGKRPFVAKLVDKDVWEVTGTLTAKDGGVPYIQIQKCDCRVLKVGHGK